MRTHLPKLDKVKRDTARLLARRLLAHLSYGMFGEGSVQLTLVVLTFDFNSMLREAQSCLRDVPFVGRGCPSSGRPQGGSWAPRLSITSCAVIAPLHDCTLTDSALKVID